MESLLIVVRVNKQVVRVLIIVLGCVETDIEVVPLVVVSVLIFAFAVLQLPLLSLLVLSLDVCSETCSYPVVVLDGTSGL